MQTRISLTLYFLLMVTVSYPFSVNSRWITVPDCKNNPSTWIGYRKVVQLDSIPESAVATIAVDSKYWLWINDELVVVDGGLKRGPTPDDTYYDEVEIRPYLSPGLNTIAIKVGYFGKDGFSHKSSGTAGLLFDCITPHFSIHSNTSWKTTLLEEYQSCEEPHPNFRLSEPSILYDSRISRGDWHLRKFDDTHWQEARELGKAGDKPWNKLVKRTIPLFRFSKLKNYLKVSTSNIHPEYDTLFCVLPSNIQVTPYINLTTPTSGQRIKIYTDNYLHYNGGANLIRTEYITKTGNQEYEAPIWVNGHQVIYVVPKGIRVTRLSYRESGYDTDFTGSFECSDPFFNALWQKSARTLYLTMRDHFMDCPDRERAQWTGDAVLESGQSFYVMSPSSALLSKKWLDEFFGWQKADGSLFSPSPAGNWDKELPGQTLATIGHYGMWNYYVYTGDIHTIRNHYDKAIRYINLWKTEPTGLVSIREGGWNWGDWGENKDMKLLYNLWYYLALQGLNAVAQELGKTDEAAALSLRMNNLKNGFNKEYWNGTTYRDPLYKGLTDDRVHALAVLSGIADSDKFAALMKVFETQEHASPYMEKYVFEAMVKMGYVTEAMQRHKKRFSYMVNHPGFTTLFEGWGIGTEGFGGGTVNHAWSGGGLTVLLAKIAGIAPLTPGSDQLMIAPSPGDLQWINCTVPHRNGTVSCRMNFKGRKVKATIILPDNTSGIFKWRDKSIRLKPGKQIVKF